MRRPAAVLGLLVALTCVPTPVTAAPAPSTATLSGLGVGHGVGLSTDAAQLLAATVGNHEAILDRFFPGTQRSTRTASVTTQVWQAPAGRLSVDVQVPDGATATTGSRSLVVPASSTVVISHDTAGYHLRLTSGSDAELSGTEPLLLVPVDGGALGIPAAERTYRGSLRAVAEPRLRLVNTVDVEDYLLGVTDIRDDARPSARRAEAVAARSLALALPVTRTGLHYGGVNAETPRRRAAVDGTRGEVVTFRSRVATTYLHRNSGGLSAGVVEGLGAARDVPYLPSGRSVAGPAAPWRVTVDLGTAQRALDYPGTLLGITAGTRGPSGRATTLRLTGSAGPLDVPAVPGARALGLPSTLLDGGRSALGVGTATVPVLPAVRLPRTVATDAPAPVVAPAPEVYTAPAETPAPVTTIALASDDRDVVVVREGPSPIWRWCGIGLLVTVGLRLGSRRRQST